MAASGCPSTSFSPAPSAAVSRFRASKILRLGLIKEGLQADITVFDFENVKSLCTYENDARPAYPEGIPYVIVNGVPVIDDNQLTEALPGKVLRHAAA